MAVGTLQPTKKFEIWDGINARFTFSGNSCTSGYEVAQTIDDNGYKLNIGSSVKNYTIAQNGIDKFKILKNDNLGFGSSVLNNTTGSNNIALGSYSLTNNTSGSYNIALSLYALYSNTVGYGGVALGNNALRSNTTGNLNIAIGSNSLYSNTTGSYNIGIGYNAGRYCPDGSTLNTTSTNSIFIGKDSKANANGQTNQIVIGDNATGSGSNTVTIGNNNITHTYLKGNIGIGINNPGSKLEVGGNVKIFGNNYIVGSNVLTFQDDARFTVTQANIPDLNLSAYSMPYYGIAAPNAGNSADLWLSGNNAIRMFTGGSAAPILSITSGGKVGIGLINPDELLTVKGIIHAQEIKIDLSGPLADYVFSPDYRLTPLCQVEQFVLKNRHLPNIPSAEEVSKSGLSVGLMQNKLLEKVEELTLYVIQQDKEIQVLKEQIKQLSAKNQ